MAVYYFLCLFWKFAALDDESTVVFRLQKRLNVIRLFVQRCFHVTSSVMTDVNSFLGKLTAGSFQKLFTLWIL